MQRQAELAREYGVDGFVMYHYWFDGKKLLDTPLANLLDDPAIDFPFALCWANENWTRRWDGLDSEILIAQGYGEGWADRFYDDIRPALGDHRYITVEGRPLLVLYRIGQIKDARAAVERWKARAKEDGLGGLHVLAVNHSRHFEELPRGIEEVIDGLVQFPPLNGIGLQSVKDIAGVSRKNKGDVYSYDAAVNGAELTTTSPQGLRIHPGVMPGWDNTPRRRDSAYVFHGANPLSFRRWVARASAAAAAAGTRPSLLFVNAWNEWAEGAHLEPDARFGRAFLEAIRDLDDAGEQVTMAVPNSSRPASPERVAR
jgi:lipopolysaccharide biosynthesis protein